MRTSLRAAAVALALGAPGASWATTYTVPVDFPTIQAAVDAAVSGDTVLVEPGTYRGPISVVGKGINLASTGGPGVTILDGDAAGTVVSFSSTGYAGSLTGFTVTNGNGSWGGGVAAIFSNVAIRNCLITGNTAINGGGVSAAMGYMVVSVYDSEISDNRATAYGGGTYGTYGGLQLFRTRVANNTAGISGGGMVGRGNCGIAVAYESSILGNSAPQAGGGIWVGEGNTCTGTNLYNTLVAGNSSARGGGIAADGLSNVILVHATVADNVGDGLWGAATIDLKVFNSILWANGRPPVLPPPGNGSRLTPNTIVGSVVEGGVPAGYETDPAVVTNSAADPLFAPPGEYRLAAGSPAIDRAVAIDPNLSFPITVDHDGVARPQGPASDAGAFEYVDTVPPVTTLTLQGTAGAAGWYTSNVVASLRATDVGLGVNALLLSLNGGLEYAYPAASDLPLDTDGVWTLGYRAVDLAGNAETLHTATISIDRVAPAVSSTVTGTVGAAGWYRSAAVVALAATDATSGVASLGYRVDGAAETVVPAASASVSLGDGQHTVVYRATDVAGNASATATRAVAVDTRAPSATLSLSPTSLRANGKLQAVRLGGSASDAGSGVASVVIVVTNKAGATVATATAFGGTVQLPGTKGQVYKVTATVTDRAGNSVKVTANLPVL